MLDKAGTLQGFGTNEIAANNWTFEPYYSTVFFRFTHSMQIVAIHALRYDSPPNRNVIGLVPRSYLAAFWSWTSVARQKSDASIMQHNLRATFPSFRSWQLDHKVDPRRTRDNAGLSAESLCIPLHPLPFHPVQKEAQ
jgi:hypothetical protein